MNHKECREPSFIQWLSIHFSDLSFQKEDSWSWISSQQVRIDGRNSYLLHWEDIDEAPARENVLLDDGEDLPFSAAFVQAEIRFSPRKKFFVQKETWNALLHTHQHATETAAASDGYYCVHVIMLQGTTLREILRHPEEQMVGKRLGTALRTLHQSACSVDRTIWDQIIQTDIDYLLYQYSLLSRKLPRSYLIYDLIQRHRHVLQGEGCAVIACTLSLDHCGVDQEGYLFLADPRPRCGDAMYDLLFLNDAAEYSLPFVHAFLDAYFEGERPRVAFRRIYLYTAILLLKRFVEMEKQEVTFQDVERAKAHFEWIEAQYDQFNSVYPLWALRENCC